jgi:DNA-binding response OmpR family regulator
MRLLLIEDEPDLGAAIKKVLNQETYVVDWILDGNQAWSYLETQWAEYTLAIIDWMLPELLARLRALRRRSPQLQPPKLQAGNLTLNYGTHSVTRQGATDHENQVIPLTIKEFQLLEYFMKHPNQIVNRDQIMNQLWEVDEEPISNVVAAQVRLLRRKLEDSNNSLIETIYGVGYRFNPNL